MKSPFLPPHECGGFFEDFFSNLPLSSHTKPYEDEKHLQIVPCGFSEDVKNEE